MSKQGEHVLNELFEALRNKKKDRARKLDKLEQRLGEIEILLSEIQSIDKSIGTLSSGFQKLVTEQVSSSVKIFHRFND